MKLAEDSNTHRSVEKLSYTPSVELERIDLAHQRTVIEKGGYVSATNNQAKF